VVKLKRYNAIPLNDTNHDNQLKLLNEIQENGRGIHRHLDTWGFMNAPGTVRSMGGPARLGYYHLIGKLTRLTGGSYSSHGYVGQTEREIAAVEQQAGKTTTTSESSPQRSERPKRQKWHDGEYQHIPHSTKWGLNKYANIKSKPLAGRAGLDYVGKSQPIKPERSELMDAPIMYSEQGLEATKQKAPMPERSELMDAPAMFSEEGLEGAKQKVEAPQLPPMEQPGTRYGGLSGGHRRKRDDG